MTAPANNLVSDDPYATAVRLLQVGANLTMHQAGDLVSNLDHEAVTNLGLLAHTDDTAVEVVDRLMSMGRADLAGGGLHDLVDAVYATNPVRWTR